MKSNSALGSDWTTIRRKLRENRRHKFVDRDEFCELLTSRRNLQRWDVAVGGVRGLFEHVNGIRYLIEEEKLVE